MSGKNEWKEIDENKHRLRFERFQFVQIINPNESFSLFWSEIDMRARKIHSRFPAHDFLRKGQFPSWKTLIGNGLEDFA